MTKVGIADLKARLSEHLRKVRAGHTLTVVDRDRPVATIVPYETGSEPLAIRKATRRPRELELPPATTKRTDSTRVLLLDRSRR